jgi:hypothetical protein
MVMNLTISIVGVCVLLIIGAIYCINLIISRQSYCYVFEVPADDMWYDLTSVLCTASLLLAAYFIKPYKASSQKESFANDNGSLNMQQGSGGIGGDPRKSNAGPLVKKLSVSKSIGHIKSSVTKSEGGADPEPESHKKVIEVTDKNGMRKSIQVFDPSH